MAYTLARLCFGVSVYTLALAHASEAKNQANAHTHPSSTVQYPGMREPQALPASASPWEGPYAGVTAGYNLNTVNTRGSVNGQHAGLPIPATLKGNVVAHGFEGGIFAGYGQFLYSDLLAAVELSADLDSVDGKLSKSSLVGNFTQDFLIKMQKKESFGGSVRIGKLINGLLPYAKVGVVATRWQMNLVHNYDGVSAQKTWKKFMPGLQAGIGVEMPMSKKIRFRAEYALTAYPSMRTKVTFANATTGYTANAKIRPLSHTVKLGVAMPFRYN